MKANKILLFCLITASSASVFAAPPAPRTPEKVNGSTGGDYYQHGFNATSTNDTPLPSELRDSVTATSTAKYFVLPDPVINETWYLNDGSLPSNLAGTAGLKSSFKWRMVNSLGTSSDANPNLSPVLTVTWGATVGIDTLKFSEVPIPSSGTIGGCSDSTAIPVELIDIPTITFNQVNGEYAHDTCVQAVNNLVYNFPLTVTSDVLGNKQIQISYTFAPTAGVSNPTASPVTAAPLTYDVAGRAIIPITFTDYGTYTVTLTDVTDRISRKSITAVQGVVPADGAGNKFAFTIWKKAQPGPIYRLPNDY